MLNSKPEVSKRGRKAVETKKYLEQSQDKINIWEAQLKLMKDATKKLQKDPNASIVKEVDEIEKLDKEITKKGLQAEKEDAANKALDDYELFRKGDFKRNVSACTIFCSLYLLYRPDLEP